MAAVLAAAFLVMLVVKAYAGATPWIRATPRPEQNLVHLEWGMAPASETGNYNYMVYKREASEPEFQSIPVKDRVKVLNIYPPVGDPVTFTNWKGQRFTLPKAASLKRWMEEPNAEHPKGYGMGLIDVDAVPIPDFNANPVKYLKNPDGSWKYDVIFNGSWDVNAGYDLNAKSLPVVEEFIRSGRGYLTGHDTMFGDRFVNTYTRKLRQFFRIKVGHPWDWWDALPGEIDYKDPKQQPYYPTWFGGTKVKIIKKGLLTNYPWKIGEPGTILTVPNSHSTSQYAFGDVWLVYTNYYTIPSPPHDDDPVDSSGTGNFYLTTWCNTAMIQTGHSNCEATPDEQKIIANTLFYLAQVTDGTSWDDHSAQDVAPPDPVAGIQTNPVPGGIEITWQRPKDNGNTYYYYVQAINKATGDRLNSAVVGPVSYASGIKGYAYVIDRNPSTDPRATVNLAQEKISVALNPGKYYLHIRAVDNAGNVSEVRHFAIEVGFELQAALEPNPAARGQKVRVYAALTVSAPPSAAQYSGYRASPYDEVLEAEDGQVTRSGSYGYSPDGKVVWLMGGWLEARFSRPATAVYIQFNSSDHNDGYAKVYVDGTYYGSFQTRNKGHNYIRVVNLPAVAHTVRVENSEGDLHVDFFGVASELADGTRSMADSIYAILPNGQQLGMNWDSQLQRYWCEFIVPDGGTPGTWPGNGTYTVKVRATKYGVTKEIPLSLTVQGNIKEKMYIRTLEW